MDRKRAALGIFLVALLLRLVHVSQIRAAPFFQTLLGDAGTYDQWAQRLAAGDWIGRDVFYQAPLYPYFLGVIYRIFGRDLLLVRICQAIVGSAACVLLFLAGTRIFSRRAGIIAGLGLALYAPAIFMDGLIQKATLDVFFLCLALWLLSIDAWLALGLTLGALALTRENALVLGAVILLWSLLGPARGRATPVQRAGAFLLGCAIVLLPVAVRNYAVSGGAYLTTSQFGPNFYIGNNPLADGTYVPLRAGRGTPRYEREDATAMAEHAAGRTLTPSEVSRYWTDEGLHFIATEPARWLSLTARKFVLLWNAREVLDTESQETHAEWSWVLRAGGWIGHFGVLVPLALLGLIVTWPMRRRIWVLHAMVGAYALTLLVFYVVARYRLPLVPLLVLFGAAGLAHAFDDVRGGWSRLANRRAVGVLAMLVVAAAFSNWPVLPARTMRAATETNLAAELQVTGRLDDAIAHNRRAIELDPGYAPAHYNLGLALANVQAFEQARAEFEEAVRLAPGHAQAHNNLAALLQVAQRFEEAESHYRQAVALDALNANARTNLATLLSDRGRLDDAARYFRESLQLRPDEPAALFGLAWIHATAPAPPLRDTAEAIRLAERAAELSGPDNQAAQETLTAIRSAALPTPSRR